jgi:cysteinyl-tRNA synthetase
MPLHLKNTYTKSIVPFDALDPARTKVLLYSCGPTVYSYAHIGNFRSFLVADLLRRVLERRGYSVRHVMNITDVGHMTQDHLADATGEDKLAIAARELGWDPYRVAAHFEAAFIEDAKALRMKNYSGADALDPELHPRATRYVPEMLEMIQVLIARGYAYCDAAGQVYFEIAKFPHYGQLSGKVIDDLEEGARVAVRTEKKDPRDFALWKVDQKHLMQWDPHSPAGWQAEDWERFRRLVPGGVDARIRPGFPGWHIECSAMSRALLGPVIDLHTGGEDNIFPHHECEIAQSFGAATEPSPPDSFARYWVHGRHLLVDKKKMSKRDGTFFTVRDLMNPATSKRPDLAARLAEIGFADGRVPASVLRYALMSNQYTQPMNFGFDLLAQAKASVDRIQSRYDRLREVSVDPASEVGPPSTRVRDLVVASLREFDEALDDNLNMPNALAALFRLVGELNQMELSPADAAEARLAIESVDDVLDVLDRQAKSGVLTKERIAEALASGHVPSFESLVAREQTDATFVEGLVCLRQAARKAKDFARADEIREELKRRRVLVDDTPQGTRWRLA